MCDSSCESHGVQDRTTTNDHDVTAPVKVGHVEDLQHFLQDLDVVLDFLSTRYELDVSHTLDAVRVSSRQLLELELDFRICVCQVAIHPELDSRRLIVGGFE